MATGPDASKPDSDRTPETNKRRIYNLSCSRRNHLDIDHQNQPLFHLAIYDRGDGHPDLILRRGEGATGPQVALSKLGRSSKNCDLYLGPEAAPAKDAWDAVRCVSSGKIFSSSESFCFTATIESAESSGPAKKMFHWTKTREKELGASKWTGRDFKLVDEESEDVVAMYFDRMGMHAVGRRGRIEWLQDCGDTLEVQALMVLFSVLEKSSRSIRAVTRTLSPGGSGGAGVGAV